jgi:Flp pilus assembly protein TadG
MTRPSRCIGNRGSASVELVILAPLFGLLLLAVVAAGRVSNAHADVDAAARMAARDLSIARDPEGRRAEVERTIADTLAVGSPSCRTMTFHASITADRIDVTVACSSDLQEAAVLPLPGRMTITGTATEVRDAHRESTP